MLGVLQRAVEVAEPGAARLVQERAAGAQRPRVPVTGDDARQQQRHAGGGEPPRQLLQRDGAGGVDRRDPPDVEDHVARVARELPDLAGERLRGAEEDRALELDDPDVAAALAQHPRLLRVVDAPRVPRRAGGDAAHQRPVHRPDEQHHRQQHAGGDRRDEAEQDRHDADDDDDREAPDGIAVANAAGAQLPPHHLAPLVEEPERDDQHDAGADRHRDPSDRRAAEQQDQQQHGRRYPAGQPALAPPRGAPRSAQP